MTIVFNDCASPQHHLHLKKGGVFFGIIKETNRGYVYQGLKDIELDRGDIQEIVFKLVELDIWKLNATLKPDKQKENL